MFKPSPKRKRMLLRFRHSGAARPEQQVTFAHNIPFYSHYPQAPVALRPGAPRFVLASPRPFLRAGKKPSLKPEQSLERFQHDLFLILIHMKLQLQKEMLLRDTQHITYILMQEPR